MALLAEYPIPKQVKAKLNTKRMRIKRGSFLLRKMLKCMNKMGNKEQTAALFEHGVLLTSGDYYRAKDVEEMNGHFLMFNKMLDTLEEPLTEELIKSFHFELKSGVFEDRANGYAIGAYRAHDSIPGVSGKPHDSGRYPRQSPHGVYRRAEAIPGREED